MLSKIRRLFLKYPDPRVEAILQDGKVRKDRQVNNHGNKKIVIQATPDPRSLGLFNIMLEDLLSLQNADVLFFITRNINASIGVSLVAWMKRSSLVNWLYMRSWVNLFTLPSDTLYYTNQFLVEFNFKSIFKAAKIWRNWKLDVKNGLKNQIFCEGIRIDDLIIDTYLRYRPSGHFDIKDAFVFYLIVMTISEIKISKKVFSDDNVIVYFTTHASYTTHGVPVRVALANDVKVFSFSDMGFFGTEILVDFPYHSFNPTRNDEQFNKGNLNYFEEWLPEARRTLKFRFSGGIDPAISYMRNSSYSGYSSDCIREKINGAAILFLHDFFDSPNVYDAFIFDDFYSWAVFTIEKLIENNIKFAIKVHPNAVSESEDIQHSLMKKFPNSFWIPDNFNNLSLIKSQPRVAITVYGTVSSEFAYFGIPSICCANNPHSGHDFIYTASSKYEFEELIKNIEYMSTRCRQKVHFRRQALDYFIKRNSLYDSLAREANTALIAYWKSLDQNTLLDHELIRANLKTITSTQKYKNFLEKVANELR